MALKWRKTPKSFGLKNWAFGEFLEFVGVFGVVWGVFGESWRSRERLIDMYGLYWFYCGCIYRYTVSICKHEVYTMWSVWRFRGSSGGLETLAEA